MSLFLWRFCIRSVNSAVVFHGPSATEHAGPELKYSIATAAKCLFNVPVLIYLCISFCKTLTLYSHGHYWSKIVFFFSFLFLQEIYKYKLYTISQNLIVKTTFLHFTFFF